MINEVYKVLMVILNDNAVVAKYTETEIRQKDWKETQNNDDF